MHKKFTTILISIFAGLVIIFSASYLFNKKEVVENPTGKQIGLAVNKNEELNDPAKTDQDGDGLFDWEENLWGTDPTKIDSNDDGIDDFTEVQKRKEQVRSGDFSSLPEENTNNETEKFSRDFLLAYTAALEQGEELDDNFIESLSERFSQTSAIEPFFTLEDITVSGNGQEAEDKYTGEIFDLAETYKNSRMGEEIGIIARIEQGEDLKEELSKISEDYKSFAEAAQKIVAPEDSSSSHLDLINSLHGMGTALEDFNNDTDPIKTILALKKYKYWNDLFASTFKTLRGL
jgi:hypothetical protein